MKSLYCADYLADCSQTTVLHALPRMLSNRGCTAAGQRHLAATSA
jgi:hypothetical protein